MAKRPHSYKSPEPADGSGSDAFEEIKYPRRTARRKQTRANILHAAASLFNTSGYGATTMQNIADSADIHVTTLFMHFSSKSDLAISLATISTDELRERALPACGSVPFFDFFRAEMVSAANAAKDKTDPTMALWSALRNDSELTFAWSEFEKAQRDIFSDYIADEYGLDRGTSYVPDLVASLLVSSALLPHQKWAEAPKKIDLLHEVQTSIALAETAARGILKEAAK